MMPEAARTSRRSLLLATLAAASLALAGLAGLVTLPSPEAGAAPAQQSQTYYVPDLQSRGYTTASLAAAAGERPSGMVGFGYTALDLVNRSDAAVEADIRLINFDVSQRRSQKLGPRRAGSLVLKRDRGIGLGDYNGIIEADGELGVLARSEWPEGGSAFSYLAPEPSSELILPLAVRNVYSHSSLLHIQNAAPGPDRNQIEMIFFDRLGGIQKQLTLRLDEDESTHYDMLFDAQFSDLPTNSGNGYVNAIRFSAQEPVVALTLDDELGGIGTSAIRARPIGLARRVQHLPLVRANHLGDSWIGIANREDQAVDVTVTYRGAEDSPSGAGQRFEQQLRIEARSAAFIDLAGRGRGTDDATGLPRGGGVNRGFYGSATIEASGRVLAAVLEGAYEGATARTSAGYNAFGPIDLATAWAAPVAGRGTAGRVQHLVVFNPGADPVGLKLSLLTQAGGRAGEQESVLQPGAMSLLPVRKPADLPVDQVLLEASAPVAVLDYETGLTGTSDWGRWGADTLVEWAVPVPGGGGETPPTSTPTVTPPPPTATPTDSPEPGTTPDTPTPSVTPDPGIRIYLPFGIRNS